MTKRLNPWIVHSSLAMIMVVAVADFTTPSRRDDKDKFVLAVSCISLILGALIVVSHFVEKIRSIFIGTLLEVAISGLILILWFVAIIILQNPKNEMSTIITGAGIEEIKYANLYFFGWLTFFSSVFLIASVFRDTAKFDAKLLTWSLLFFTSIVLFGTAVNLKKDICAYNPGKMCTRTDFAIAIGVIVSLMSATGAACLVCMKDRLKPMVDLVLSFLSAIMYFFGVTILTSASGPASTLGTLYFSTWAGAALSYLLFITVFRQVFLSSSNEEVEVDTAVVESQIPPPTGTRNVGEVPADDASEAHTLPHSDHVVEMNMQDTKL